MPAKTSKTVMTGVNGTESPTDIQEAQIQTESLKYGACYISPVGEQYRAVFTDCVLKALPDSFHVEQLTSDSDTVPSVDNYDLCIADISRIDFFVCLMLGVCITKGKKIILLSSSRQIQIPNFIQSEPFITYKWLAFGNAIISVQETVKQFLGRSDIGTVPQNASAPSPKKAPTDSALVAEIEKLKKRVSAIEEKLNSDTINAATSDTADLSDIDPNTAFQLALASRNVTMAEKAMSKLQGTVNKLKFLDYYVEQVAAMGSLEAGNMMIKEMEYFFTSNVSCQKKVEYMGALISYLNKNDMEEEYIDIICRYGEAVKDSNGVVPDGVWNQINRLYYGAYGTTRRPEYLDTSIEYIRRAIVMNPNDTSYLYNLSGSLNAKAELLPANDHIERQTLLEESYRTIKNCMEISKTLDKYDSTHLAFAIKAYRRQGDNEWESLYGKLRSIDPLKAELLKRQEKLTV